MCIWSQPDLTVSFLTQHNLFDILFSQFLNNTMDIKEDYECVRIFLGLVSLLKLQTIP
jgi:hypothetical protein